MTRIALPLCIALGVGHAASARAGEAAVARYGRDATARPAPAEPREQRLALLIFSDQLQAGWLDGGGSPRDLAAGSAARIDFGNNGNWVVTSKRPVPVFTSLRFDMLAPASFSDSLTVRLGNDTRSRFPTVRVRPRHVTATSTGWVTVRISSAELNPSRLPVTSIRLAALRTVESMWVQINRLAIEGVEDEAVGFNVSALGDLPDTDTASVDTLPVTEVGTTADANASGRNRRTRGVGIGAHAGVILSPSSPAPGYVSGLDVHFQPSLELDYILAVALEGSLVYRNLRAEPMPASVGSLAVRSSVVEVPLIAKVAGGVQLAGGATATADFGVGATMVRATTDKLGVVDSGSRWSLVLRAGIGVGMQLGPGVGLLEVAYLHVGEVNFEGMLERYAPGGLIIGLRYAFDT